MLETQLTNWTGKGRLPLTEVVIRWLTIQLVQREDSSCRSFNLEIPSWNPFIPTTTTFQVSRENIRSAGDRAFLVSREMDGTTRPRCMSFWFFMYEPIVDTTGHFMEVLYNVVMNEFEETHDIGFQILYSSLHRTQSGKTCSVDENNQPSGSAGNVRLQKYNLLFVLNQTVKGDDPSVAASQWARTKLAVWASSSHHWD